MSKSKSSFAVKVYPLYAGGGDSYLLSARFDSTRDADSYAKAWQKKLRAAGHDVPVCAIVNVFKQDIL